MQKRLIRAGACSSFSSERKNLGESWRILSIISAISHKKSPKPLVVGMHKMSWLHVPSIVRFEGAELKFCRRTCAGEPACVYKCVQMLTKDSTWLLFACTSMCFYVRLSAYIQSLPAIPWNLQTRVWLSVYFHVIEIWIWPFRFFLRSPFSLPISC